MKMKASWAAIFVAANAWAAGYVPWQASYELWMPVITSNSSTTVLTQPSKQLPFAEPTASFSPAPVYQKVPFDPAGALVIDQKFFAVAAPEGQGEAWRLQIDGVGTSQVEALPAGAQPPEELILVKSATGVTILAAWSPTATAEERQKLLESVQKALSAAPEGQYSARLSRP